MCLFNISCVNFCLSRHPLLKIVTIGVCLVYKCHNYHTAGLYYCISIKLYICLCIIWRHFLQSLTNWCIKLGRPKSLVINWAWSILVNQLFRVKRVYMGILCRCKKFMAGKYRIWQKQARLHTAPFLAMLGSSMY